MDRLIASLKEEFQKVFQSKEYEDRNKVYQDNDVEAAGSGRFHIYAVSTIDKATQSAILNVREKIVNPYLFMQQGNQAFSKGDYQSALTFYLKAQEGIREDESPLADLYGNIGNIYAVIEKIDDAIAYYKKAVTILRRLEDYARLGATYVNLGNLYTDADDVAHAVYYYKQAALLLERTEQWHALAVLYGNLSLVLRKGEEYETSLIFAERSITLAKKLQENRLIADATARLAKAKECMGDIKDAQKHSAVALTLYSKLDDEMGCAAALYHQAALYEQTGDLENAIVRLKQVVAIDEKYQLPKLEKNKQRLKKLEEKRGI